MTRPRATHPHPALLGLADDLDAADDSPAGSADHSVDEAETALRVARAISAPCLAADEHLDEMQRLRFWRLVIAYMLGVAESSVGADGRMAIVQCMRSVPPSSVLLRQGLQ